MCQLQCHHFGSTQVACMLCLRILWRASGSNRGMPRLTARVAGSERVAKCDALLLRYSVPQQQVPRHLHREHLKTEHARKSSSTPRHWQICSTWARQPWARMRLESRKMTHDLVLHPAAASELRAHLGYNASRADDGVQTVRLGADRETAGPQVLPSISKAMRMIACPRRSQGALPTDVCIYKLEQRGLAFLMPGYRFARRSWYSAASPTVSTYTCTCRPFITLCKRALKSAAA